jgi:hypothetical protein
LERRLLPVGHIAFNAKRRTDPAQVRQAQVSAAVSETRMTIYEGPPRVLPIHSDSHKVRIVVRGHVPRILASQGINADDHTALVLGNSVCTGLRQGMDDGEVVAVLRRQATINSDTAQIFLSTTRLELC